ncbi:MAG: phosphodiesterase [Vulcanimicrobiaceae bacterium]
MLVTVVQFTDTHVVPSGSTHHGTDTAAYLAAAVAAVNGLAAQPAYVVVTGDLVDRGAAVEYERFRDLMAPLHVPYYVIPGNHDDRDRLRDVLDPATFGGSRDATIRFAIDERVRFIGLDGCRPRPSPGATLDASLLAWLEATLDAAPERPTIVGVHQPPFRTGLHYLDVFGFRGRRALRTLVDRRPNVGRVISGHIHCHKRQAWATALACSVPSTAPQLVPQLFMDGRICGVRRERAGFAAHAWDAERGFTTMLYHRDERGAYSAETLLL